MAVLWVNPVDEPVAVTVSVEFASGVELAVATVNVEEPEPPLIVVGLNFAVAPAGNPVTFRPTLSVKPLTPSLVTV